MSQDQWSRLCPYDVIKVNPFEICDPLYCDFEKEAAIIKFIIGMSNKTERKKGSRDTQNIADLW